MKYMGSKSKYAKELLDIMLEDRKDNQWFVDLFAGGFNVIDKVKGNRIANDINPYVTSLFCALQNGWKPPLWVSENEYKNIKENKKDYSRELVGYVGFNSYGGKFFAGYRRDSEGKRNYWQEHFNNIMKQVDNVKDVFITCKDYQDVSIPQNSIIYCDPPYFGTTKYQNTIDHISFWNWIRSMKLNGHTVFVSEYTAPHDFVCIYEKKVNNSLTVNTGAKKGVEKLFTLI